MDAEEKLDNLPRILSGGIVDPKLGSSYLVFNMGLADRWGGGGGAGAGQHRKWPPPPDF